MQIVDMTEDKRDWRLQFPVGGHDLKVYQTSRMEILLRLSPYKQETKLPYHLPRIRFHTGVQGLEKVYFERLLPSRLWRASASDAKYHPVGWTNVPDHRAKCLAEGHFDTQGDRVYAVKQFVGRAAGGGWGIHRRLSESCWERREPCSSGMLCEQLRSLKAVFSGSLGRLEAVLALRIHFMVWRRVG